MARVSSLAGRWYEADPVLLAQQIDAWLGAAAPTPARAPPRALILPHAGYRWSGAVAARALAPLGRGDFTRVVVMGPSHHLHLGARVALPGAKALTTPLGTTPLDLDVIGKLATDEVFVEAPDAFAREHSVEIELPLLQRVLGDFTLVPLVVGDLDWEVSERVATRLLDVVDARTLVVVSSDFTHYGASFGYEPFEDDVLARIERLDLDAFARIQARDADGFARFVRETGATICGRRPIEVLLRMLPPDARVTLEARDTSGRLTGDDEHSVSYLAVTCRFDAWPCAAGPSGSWSGPERRRALDLARRAVGFALEEGGGVPEAADLGFVPEGAWLEPSGVFVTLRRRDGRLRGCIGQLQARKPLWQALVRAAIAAATEDPRFPPVARSEVADLSFKISILTQPEPVDAWSDIELGRHGIVLRQGLNTATFLPEVPASQGWDLETTLAHLSVKAGLDAAAWRRGATFEVFESIAFGDEDDDGAPAAG